jgi:hypothetical protein
MSKCRGQWAEDQPCGTCIQCGGKLSDHETYAAWMLESTYDERRALSFNPPLAIHQPPALLPDPQPSAVNDFMRQWINWHKQQPVAQPPKPQLSEKQEREASGIQRALESITRNGAIIGSFVMGHR